MNIEIAYVSDQKPVLLQASVAEGTSIAEALKALVFPQYLPENLASRIGIFGIQKSLDTILRAGDRIEIYEFLLLDPKEARRLKALASARRFKKERKA